jgi:phospholipase C
MTGSPTPRPVTRAASSVPFPETPVGTVNEQMPFDHLVVVMMENHSFDNLLGDLGRTRSGVDGLTFDSSGNATNSNPNLAVPPVRPPLTPAGRAPGHNALAPSADHSDSGPT